MFLIVFEKSYRIDFPNLFCNISLEAVRILRYISNDLQVWNGLSVLEKNSLFSKKRKKMNNLVRYTSKNEWLQKTPIMKKFPEILYKEILMFILLKNRSIIILVIHAVFLQIVDLFSFNCTPHF